MTPERIAKIMNMLAPIKAMVADDGELATFAEKLGAELKLAQLPLGYCGLLTLQDYDELLGLREECLQAVEAIVKILQSETGTDPRELARGVALAEEMGAKALREQFFAWRAEADCDELLDGFDLALGWLAGKGVDHDRTLELINDWGLRPTGGDGLAYDRRVQLSPSWSTKLAQIAPQKYSVTGRRLRGPKIRQPSTGSGRIQGEKINAVIIDDLGDLEGNWSRHIGVDFGKDFSSAVLMRMDGDKTVIEDIIREKCKKKVGMIEALTAIYNKLAGRNR